MITYSQVTLLSDQHQISPCNNNVKLSRLVTKIKDLINQSEFAWYFNKFSPLPLKEMHRYTNWELSFDVRLWSVKHTYWPMRACIVKLGYFINLLNLHGCQHRQHSHITYFIFLISDSVCFCLNLFHIARSALTRKLSYNTFWTRCTVLCSHTSSLCSSWARGTWRTSKRTKLKQENTLSFKIIIYLLLGALTNQINLGPMLCCYRIQYLVHYPVWCNW